MWHVLRHLKEELAWATDEQLQVISNIAYSGKAWQGKSLANWLFSSTWWKKVWRNHRSTNRLLILSTNLDGFSLVDHRQFAKFAKHFHYTVILFKTVILLRNKAILSLQQYCMCSYVVLVTMFKRENHSAIWLAFKICLCLILYHHTIKYCNDYTAWQMEALWPV